MATSAQEFQAAIKSFGVGMLKGNTADTVGAPVDMVNTLIAPLTKPLGIHTDTPFGGSAHVRTLLGLEVADKNLMETAGTTASVGGFVKAMIVGAARVGNKLDDVVDIEKAQEMFRDHPEVNPSSVFNMTGVYQGEEKGTGMRTVISDAAAKLHITPAKNSSEKLSKVLNHPQLFELYPELKNIDVVAADIPPRSGSYVSPRGMFDPGTIKISANSTPEEQLSVLLHETQHGIQDLEGWKQGGSPKQFLPKNVDAQAKAVQEAVKRGRESNDPAVQEAAERFKDRFNAKLRTAHTKYENIPGEQEARFTQDTRELNTAALANGIRNMLKQGQTPQNWDTQKLPSAVKEGTVIPPATSQNNSVLDSIRSLITD